MRICIRLCPVCKGAVGKELHSTQLRNQLLSDYELVSCVSCGMVYADTPTSQETYNAYYAEQSKYVSNFADWNTKRYHEAADRIDSLVDKNSAIVDIGCATGGLLTQLRNRGFSCAAGLDPSARCVEQAGALQGTIYDLVGSWDCAILSHVLEHLVNVQEAISKLSKHARSIYVEVPNATRYVNTETSPYQQINAEHINHFNLESLQKLFAAHHYSLRACGEYECEPARFPAFWAYFTRTEPLITSMRRYLNLSEALLGTIKTKLANLPGPVFAWGIGALARQIEPCLEGKVELAVDQNPAILGSSYAGVYVTNSDGLKVCLLPGKPLPILITTILHASNVKRDIRALLLPNPVLELS